MVGSHETGNETYVTGLVGGFSRMRRDYQLLVYHLGDAWQADTDRIHLRRLATGAAPLRLALELPLRSLRDRLDVLHTTYAAPAWSAGALVVTVHDITFATNPEWFSPRDLRVLSVGTRLAVRRAARVITVSTICRDQIIEHYRLPAEKVIAVPNAAGPAAEHIEEAAAREELRKLGLSADRPYVLAVGNLQPRKNLVRLIAAFRQVAGTRGDVDLVLAGPKHYRSNDVIDAAREAKDRVRFTGYLTDRQLAACYRCASVFAFPSLFEGFGIPALEAMAHGVPVACSRAGALPEVCGDAATYFDPTDVGSIADALEAALADNSLRDQLILAGRRRQGVFTWSKTAELTLRQYQEAAQARANS